jgi:hypothetical protein
VLKFILRDESRSIGLAVAARAQATPAITVSGRNMRKYGVPFSPRPLVPLKSVQARWATGGALALLVLSLSACSGGTTPHSSTTTTTHHKAPASGTVPLGSIPVNTTTTAPVPGASAGAACVHSQLRVAQVSSSLYKQSNIGVFAVTNSSKTRCSLNGYPTLGLFGSKGPLPSKVTDGAVVGVSALAQSLVTLAPGGQASFALSWTSTSTTASCPVGTGAVITLPQVTGRYTVPTIIRACGGLLNISAVQPNVVQGR